MVATPNSVFLQILFFWFVVPSRFRLWQALLKKIEVETWKGG